MAECIEMVWRARGFSYLFPRPALVMGVVNVTPDSFSDGGMYLEPARAIEHGLALVEEGADILDIGGESTRPGSAPVPEEEEKRRVLPVIAGLAGQARVPLSIDTQKPAVARAALEAGASIVNDIAANRDEREMSRCVAEFGAGYVAMHMQGTPRTMQQAPHYEDVVKEVDRFFGMKLDRFEDEGIAKEQVVLDPGIGFGKTLEHNLELLGALGHFRRRGRPLLLGVSRKSFLGRLLGLEVQSRMPPGLACACWGIIAGVQLIRTHDVKETVQAGRMIEAILARQMND